MATGTVIFRPSSDISLGHTCSSGSNGYSMISEQSADNDSTYIYQTLSSTSNSSISSSFKMVVQDNIPSNATFSNVRLHIVAIHSNDNGTGSVSGSVTINGVSKNLNNQTCTTSYSNLGGGTQLDFNGVACSSEITTSISSSGTKATGMKSSNGYVRITQIYIEADYEYKDAPPEGTNLHIKYNGSLVVVKSVYRKIDGVLVEQTDLQTLNDPNIKYIRRF